MSRMVRCIKLEKEEQGLAYPPYPGEKGVWIYENISQKAWDMWLQHQTRLINEKKLNVSQEETRNYLNEQMEKFFHNQPCDIAQGYVPEKK